MSACDREASIMRRSCPNRGCCAIKKYLTHGATDILDMIIVGGGGLDIYSLRCCVFSNQVNFQELGSVYNITLRKAGATVAAVEKYCMF